MLVFIVKLAEALRPELFWHGFRTIRKALLLGHCLFYFASAETSSRLQFL